jgi:signal transduction histidine kinase
VSAWQAAALAVSIFNAIICLWLGMTVTLDGGRDRGPRLAAAGMLMAGVFFLVHAAIVGRGPPVTGVGLPFWWRVISVPSLLAPYAWYATMVWYTGVSGRTLTGHKILLVVLGLFIGVLVLLLTAIYPLPPQARTLALKIIPAWLVAGLPFIVAGYLLTLISCFVLPIHALWTGQGRREHLPRQAWARVRMWLVRTSLLGLLAGLLALGGAVLVFANNTSRTTELDWQSGRIARLFFQLDVAVLVVVAAALGAAGQAVGAYAAFTERPLPQWNRIDQWRWLVFIAAAFALVVGASEALGIPSIYTLLFATTLAALAYALLSWRYRIEHEAFMERLRPFVGSLHFQDRLLDGGTSLSAAVAGLVEAVSRDVLRAERACLILRDRIPGLPPAVAYQWGAAPVPQLDGLDIPLDHQRSAVRLPASSGAEWAIPLWDGRGLAGALVLGAPLPGAVYSEELMEVAAACCARLTDALAGERAARMLADVLRQRIAEVKVLGSQGRRTLHDDVLPHIHAALIHLSAMPDDTTAQNAVTALSSAHRELSALIRTLPPATPHRLEHVGLVQTLHDLATLDFGAAFDAVTWNIAPGVEAKLAKTPQFVGEVVSYAVQETLRNAARHARGSDSRRPLHVAVTIAWQHGLSIEIVDDGVGIANSQTNGGAGAGLRLHRGLLGVLGGTLQITTPAPGGTLIRLFIPEDLWILPVIEGVPELGE